MTSTELFIQHFNTVSLWTINIILAEPDVKKRRGIIKKLFEVVDVRCWEKYFNFFTEFARTPKF